MKERKRKKHNFIAVALSDVVDDLAIEQKVNKELKLKVKELENNYEDLQQINIEQSKMVKRLEDDLEYYENKEYHKQCAEEYMDDIRRGMNET